MNVKIGNLTVETDKLDDVHYLVEKYSGFGSFDKEHEGRSMSCMKCYKMTSYSKDETVVVYLPMIGAGQAYGYFCQACSKTFRDQLHR